MSKRECAVQKNIPRNFLIIFFLSVFICACDGRKTASWTEEVRLDDGKIIKVHRRDIFMERGALFSPWLDKVSAEITFEEGGTWSSVYLEPLIVGYHEGNLYVVSTFNICGYWNQVGEPMPPYVTQVYANGQWVNAKPTWLPDHVDRNLATGRHNMNFMSIKYKDENLVQMTRGWVHAEFTGYHVDATQPCIRSYKPGEKK